METNSISQIEQQLGAELIRLYRQTVFGKIAKSDIDLRVFSALVRLQLASDSALWRNDHLQWIRLEPRHLRALSLHLRITETRVASLVEQCALAEGAEELDATAALHEVRRLAEKFHQDRSDLEQGRLRLFIPNRFARRAIESFLTNQGSIPETSFHRDHLVIRIRDLLLATANRVEAGNTDNFLAQIAERAKQQAENDDAAFDQAMNASSIGERAGQLGTAILRHGLDKGVGVALGMLFAVLTGAL